MTVDMAAARSLSATTSLAGLASLPTGSPPRSDHPEDILLGARTLCLSCEQAPSITNSSLAQLLSLASSGQLVQLVQIGQLGQLVQLGQIVQLGQLSPELPVASPLPTNNPMTTIPLPPSAVLPTHPTTTRDTLLAMRSPPNRPPRAPRASLPPPSSRRLTS
ncbi:hypothetical protein G7Z17_g7198 [Cylindrodendrum hubeiense]|uniref:Uncharacterized protein n=1 Tax=Cylindrodendrum hubeiense TaxID=595255 RepID=A0A9P5H9G7_9HYPO|nr:hypothetical protein G7Z17_g7198 [Cylindrodendrum hubeiense]